VLARLAQGAAAASNVSAVCRVAVEAISSKFDYPRLAIYLVRNNSLALETHAGYRVAPASFIELEGDDAEATSESVVPATGHPTSLTEVRLPLRAAGELVGTLVVADEPGGALRLEQLPFLRTAGNAIAVAIHSARLLTRVRRELTRARALRGITQELTGKLDLNVVLSDVIDRTRLLFDADKAGLWLITDDPQHPFEPAAARGISDEFQASVSGLTLESPSLGVYAVRERRTYVVDHADTRGSVGIMRETYERDGIRTACVVPLVSHDRTLGILGLYHGRDHDWPEDELALAQAFANQAAVAISNARLYASAAEQAARMQSIQDLSARLNRLTDVQSIADAIVTEARELAEYHDIRIYTVDWTTRTCEAVAYTRRLLGDGDFEERLRVDIGPGSFTGTVAETGEALLINDALADQRGHTIDGTDDIDESMLVVPMLYEQRAVGVVALSKLGINQFTDDDLQTMTIFAGYAAQAIANATAYERLEQQSAELARQLDSQRRLLEINERLLGTLDHESVFELIADGLKSVVHYDNLSIYRADHLQRILVPVLARERHAEQVARYIVPFGHGLMGWAVDHRQAVLANDALADPRVAQIPGTPDDPEALIVVPLISDGVVTGSLNISRVGGAEVYFSDNDLELVKLFAGQASIALRNADTHHAVSLLAETDALTGLGNHGAFQRHLADRIEQARAADEGEHVSLLMMDLDNFKAYNDRLGHPAGDALLHAIGAAIQGGARANDGVYRYGGDEFALILRGVDSTVAASIGERVRRAVARLTATEVSPVTITVGVATWPSDADDKNEVIAAADTALYFGKQSGEDRVVLAADVPREMRDLRGTLDQLARAALLRVDEPRSVEHLVEHAARIGTEADDTSVRDALLGMTRTLDARGTDSRGHANRVGQLSAAIARRLGEEENEVRNIELAARLHGLELVAVAEMQGVPSLAAIEEIMRWSRRSGASPRHMPVAAQIVAAANAYDVMTSGTAERKLTRAAALEALRSQKRRFRDDVLDALAAAVPARAAAPRRRGSDRTPVAEERSAVSPGMPADEVAGAA
jgi:diguanylate cyclase (GGDEF)-like protein